MSNSNHSVVVDRGPVRVIKQFDTENFAVPVVKFEISSSSEVSCRIRILEAVPEEFDSAEVGFHTEHGGEYWEHSNGNRIVFERDLDPYENVTTVYGISGPEEGDSYLFESEPTIFVDSDVEEEIVAEPLPAADEMDELSEDNGETESTKPDTEPATDPDGTQVEEDDDEPVAVAPTEDSSEPDESDPSVEVTDDVVATLADALHNDEEKREELLAALGMQETRSVDTQIQHIQSRLSEFDAYIDALESFINSYGTENPATDFEGNVGHLEDELDDVRESVNNSTRELETELQDLRESLSDSEANVEDAKETATNASEQATDAKQDVSSALNRVEEVTEEMEGLRDDMENEVKNIFAEFTGLQTSVDGLRSDLDNVIDEVDELSARVDEMENHLETPERKESDDVMHPDEETNSESEGDSMEDTSSGDDDDSATVPYDYSSDDDDEDDDDIIDGEDDDSYGHNDDYRVNFDQ